MTESQVSLLNSAIDISVNENKLFEIYCVYTKKEVRYISVNYKKAQKTIDYVVELEGNVVGKVICYFEFENMPYLILEQYKREDSLKHIHKITQTNIQSVHLAEKIEKKFIYANFQNTFQNEHFITDRPNLFEGD